MVRFLRRCLLAVLVAILAWLALVGYGRLRGPTAEQQAALAVLAQATPPVAGKDGSDALWTMPYDLPDANRRHEAAIALLQYSARVDALRLAGQDTAADAVRDPLSAMPRFSAVEPNAPGLCLERDPACLATVRADPAATDAQLQAHQPGLRAARALADYDGFRYGLKPSIQSAIPSFNSQRALVRSDLALTFVRGEQAAALDGICRDIGGWRRLGGNSDVLIGSMVGAAYVEHDLQLLAEMNAELPAEFILPPSCTSALAESQAYEWDLCPAMRNEFQVTESAISPLARGQAHSFWDRLAVAALDARHFRALVAPQFAQYCDKSRQAMARSGRSWSELRTPEVHCGLFDWAADPSGCILIGAVGPNDYSKYADRRSDQAAMLGLMRLAIALRSDGKDALSSNESLAARATELGLRRPVKIGADRSQISILRFDRSRQPRFSLPLPHSQEPPPAL